MKPRSNQTGVFCFRAPGLLVWKAPVTAVHAADSRTATAAPTIPGLFGEIRAHDRKAAMKTGSSPAELWLTENKRVMKKHFFFQFPAALFLPLLVTSQGSPISLRPDVKVDFVMNVKEKVARVAKDPASGNYFYITSVGKVYEIRNINSTPTQSLVYTEADHGIAYLQGMTFIGNSLFLIGNRMIDSTGIIGMIKKATLQPNGTRVWSSVATTAIYPQSYTWYDHGFSGLVASPDGQDLYFSSGSRTDHGEIQTNNGMYPNTREVPLTSALFRIPASSQDLLLSSDEQGLSQYLYADGLRNAFDLAFDPDGQLFATENSGDRDDPDELNWIRQGRHYGFPWTMGGNDNPQQFSGYSPNSDPLLNTQSHCYIKGYYADDPGFPAKGSLVFTPPVKNLGPDADNFRENSGLVNDCSASGKSLYSFTPHRSPLGLNFDRSGVLIQDFKDGGFLVSFTRGGDSTGLDEYGYPGTIVDKSQDLLHIKLAPDGAGEYSMNATAIIKGFAYPVDTYLEHNLLYVIEHNDNGDGRLYRVTLPADPLAMINEVGDESLVVRPNPCKGIFRVLSTGSDLLQKISVYDVLGNCILESYFSSGNRCANEVTVDISTNPAGVYLVKFTGTNSTSLKKVVSY
jgi:hypothetical protein